MTPQTHIIRNNDRSQRIRAFASLKGLGLRPPLAVKDVGKIDESVF
jgi:hypothetical protein